MATSPRSTTLERGPTPSLMYQAIVIGLSACLLALADVKLVMLRGDGCYTQAIAKGNHKAVEIQGQTRQLSRLFNSLGVVPYAIDCNKMEDDTDGYEEARSIWAPSGCGPCW